MNIDLWYIYVITFSIVFFILSQSESNTLIVLIIIVLIYIAYVMNIYISDKSSLKIDNQIKNNNILYDFEFLRKYDIGRYEELLKNVSLFDQIYQKIMKNKIDHETNVLLLQDLYTNRLEILYSFYVMDLKKKDNKKLKSLIKQFRESGHKILKNEIGIMDDIVPYNFRNTNLMLP